MTITSFSGQPPPVVCGYNISLDSNRTRVNMPIQSIWLQLSTL